MSEPTVATNPEDGARAYELDRAHVFHSWSAQATLAPMIFAGASGSYVWDYDGNRYLDFSSQLVNTNIGHQHPKVIAAIQEQAGILATIAPQHANAARSEAARLIAELAPDEHEQGLLHQRRRRCERERHPDGPPAHRPAQGPELLPLVPRQHRGGDRRDRRPAALAQRVRRRPRALLRPLPLPLALLGHDARAGVRARAGSTSPTSSGSRARARSRPSSSRRSSAPPAS